MSEISAQKEPSVLSTSQSGEIARKRKELEDEELREYVRTEFVQSGFIEVQQWRNFIDYLQILLRDEKKKAVEMARKEIFDKINPSDRNELFNKVMRKMQEWYGHADFIFDEQGDFQGYWEDFLHQTLIEVKQFLEENKK